jgi:hypothetical protein
VLWTVNEFKDNTNPTNILRRGRGKKLKAIDAVLEAWNGGNLPAIDIVPALIAIMNACRTWLRAKDAAGADGGTTAMRRPRVSTLANQAFNRWQYQIFAQNKANAANAAPPALRSLQGGYTHERSTYLASGRTQAVSGSAASALAEISHNPVQANAIAGLAGVPFPANVDFNNMTDPQFTNLVNTFAPFSIDGVTQVKFLAKRERITKLIVIDTGILYDGPFSQYSTAADANGFAYVVDAYGDLITTDHSTLMHGEPAHVRFNHSSYNAGKDVISAGIIKVNQGQLTYLDNNSGHYKPTKQNLINALVILQNQGVDLSRVQAGCKERSMAHRGEFRMHVHNDADAFVRNPARRPEQIV